MANLEKDVEDLKVSTAELRAIVRDITLAQLRNENELRELKDYVQTSQTNWEKRFEQSEVQRKLAQDLQAHRQKLDTDMKAFEEKLRKDNEEYERNREQDRQEWKNEKRKMNKKWGELANKMGTLVEDIVAPNIRRLAQEIFDVGNVVDFSVCRIVTHPQDKSRFKDFDALFIGSRGIIPNETKSTVRQAYIDEFIAFIPTVFEYLPEHRLKKVIPVFSSLYIPENFVDYLTKHKIYALAMGDETMEVLNYHDIPQS